MSLTVTKQVRFNGGARGRKRLEDAKSEPDVAAGRVPRISRLMALAIEMQRLLDEGVVKDYAELARLAHVSRARVTQIMSLLNLAPDIQESLLFLPWAESGKDRVTERQLRGIVVEVGLAEAAGMWIDLAGKQRVSTRTQFTGL